MVRTLITPNQKNISIEVPQNYVGKQIEVLVYAVDEVEKKDVTNKNASAFRDIFTKEEGVKFNEYIDQSRKEWERNI